MNYKRPSWFQGWLDSEDAVPLWFLKWLNNDYAHTKNDVHWIKWLLCGLVIIVLGAAATFITMRI